MQAIEIVNALKTRKGQHVQIEWQRPCKTLKSFDGIIYKRTCAWVRSGISYANLSDVKDAIERGEREPVEGLPWGEWREGAVNFIIDHKGQEYIRLYPAVFNNLDTGEVTFLLDGKAATYAEVEPFILASEKRKDEPKPACFTVNAANILSIGK